MWRAAWTGVDRREGRSGRTRRELLANRRSQDVHLDKNKGLYPLPRPTKWAAVGGLRIMVRGHSDSDFGELQLLKLTVLASGLGLILRQVRSYHDLPQR